MTFINGARIAEDATTALGDVHNCNKRWLFRCCLNTLSEQVLSRKPYGILFHTVGPQKTSWRVHCWQLDTSMLFEFLKCAIIYSFPPAPYPMHTQRLCMQLLPLYLYIRSLLACLLASTKADFWQSWDKILLACMTAILSHACNPTYHLTDTESPCNKCDASGLYCSFFSEVSGNEQDPLGTTA